MLMEKQRTAISVLLIALGLGLLAYGLFGQSATVSSGQPGQIATMSELSITREVARGGVTRDASGEVKKTYGEGKKPPAACPT